MSSRRYAVREWGTNDVAIWSCWAMRLPLGVPFARGPPRPRNDKFCWSLSWQYRSYFSSCIFINLHWPFLLFFPSWESFDVVSFDVNVLSCFDSWFYNESRTKVLTSRFRPRYHRRFALQNLEIFYNRSLSEIHDGPELDVGTAEKTRQNRQIF